MRINGQASILRPRLKTSTSNLTDQKSRSSLINQLRNSVGTNPLVTFVETDEIFCENNICNPRSNGELIYRDQSHLNVLGSMRLAPLLTAILQQ